MISVRQLVATVLASFLILSPCAASAADVTSPERAERFIDDIGSRTMKTLTDTSLSQAEKEKRVRALLSEGLDLVTIGRFALGRTWQTATDAQRAEYSKLFAVYVLNTYARRLAAYSGETFKITGAQPMADTDALVTSVIGRPNGEPVDTGWRVRSGDRGYKIIDVLIEGVSMALTQRQEFAAVVQNKGLDGLLESLRAQNRQFAGGATTAGDASSE
ncbi:MAG TPA: ABC transporter substrate-binding protein [Alphaproteobacteria bacterium]|nr:ABC transporter substrate-binding protein [Alphaproteobacteria bacterium]